MPVLQRSRRSSLDVPQVRGCSDSSTNRKKFSGSQTSKPAAEASHRRRTALQCQSRVAGREPRAAPARGVLPAGKSRGQGHHGQTRPTLTIAARWRGRPRRKQRFCQPSLMSSRQGSPNPLWSWIEVAAWFSAYEPAAMPESGPCSALTSSLRSTIDSICGSGDDTLLTPRARRSTAARQLTPASGHEAPALVAGGACNSDWPSHAWKSSGHRAGPPGCP